MNCRPNTTLTSASTDLGPGVPWQRVVLGVVLSGLVVVTVAGNVLVVVVVASNRRLQTVFNVFIVNLAVTDMAVGVTAMSFFVVYTVLQRWPFGIVRRNFVVVTIMVKLFEAGVLRRKWVEERGRWYPAVWERNQEEL